MKIGSTGTLKADGTRVVVTGTWNSGEGVLYCRRADGCEALLRMTEVQWDADRRSWSVWAQISDDHVPFSWGYYIATETEISRVCLEWLSLRSQADPEFTIWAMPATEAELLQRMNIRLCPTEHSDWYQEWIGAEEAEAR